MKKATGYVCRQWTETSLDGWLSDKDWFATEEEAQEHGRIFVENIRRDELSREYEVFPVQMHRCQAEAEQYSGCSQQQEEFAQFLHGQPAFLPQLRMVM